MSFTINNDMDSVEILRGKEERIEFREGFSKEVIKVGSAFANAEGGLIVLGADRNGGVVGIEEAEELGREIVEGFKKHTDPQIIPEITTLRTEKGTLLLIRIPEFPLKPVQFDGKCYMREGKKVRLLGPEEIAELHLRSLGLSWDAFPARDAEIGDLDLDRFALYVEKARKAGRRSFPDKPLSELLADLELVREDRPTWAAVLLFGRDPQRFLPQAVVHCGRTKGLSEIVDHRLLGGTVIEQVDEAMTFIKRHIAVHLVISESPERMEVWDFPLEALREAVINAIVHRDYREPSDIQLRITDDKVSIWNPGHLPDGITVEGLYGMTHPSRPRNRLISQIFYDLGLIERYGSGVPRMIEALERAGLPTPLFEEAHGGFSVTFIKDLYTDDRLEEMGLTDREIEIVRYLKKKGEAKLSDIKDLFPALSDKTVYRMLQNLVESGILRASGEKKGRRYTLK
ncbi:MAG: putative DNA binding domain-containing protein [Candidatus Hydrothermae bacterium]|nr:putative DNA binding domain-containing protein [Candidatus Hydrothermae bacterium]